MAESILLLFCAQPSLYPHVHRHASVFLERFTQVHVGAIFAPGEVVAKDDRIQFHSIGSNMPVGIAGFFAVAKSVFALVRKVKVDWVEAVDPPCLVPAALGLINRSTRLLYFSMELYPELPSLVGRPMRRQLWIWAERLAVQRAQSVLTVNQSIAQILQKSLHLNRVGVVRNLPLRSFRSIAQFEARKKFLGLDDNDNSFVLVYQGKVEHGRGLESLANAIVDMPQVCLVVMGHGPLENWLYQRQKKQSNFRFLGALPYESLLQAAQGADAGVVWIEPVSESYRLSLPGKLFEYVQVGLPVLASPLPEIQSVVKQYGVGEVGEGWSAQDIQNAILRLKQKSQQGAYSENLTKAAQELCWEVESKTLLASTNSIEKRA